jgi:prepilin-type N-terminal cleavage/methylation domain-containing protein
MTTASTRPFTPTRGLTGGFTLIELLVVMGILSGFLLMLVQLVDSGVRMFSEGELGQALADRSSRAQRVLYRELSALRGSATGRDRDVVEDRLVVQRLPIGLPPRPERGATKTQVFRGAVRLPPERELELRRLQIALGLQQQNPALVSPALEEQVEALLAKEPLRGLGGLILVPWRQEGPDEALLELRAGWFLPGQPIPTGPDTSVDPFTVPVPGSQVLPGLAVWQNTLPILSELLHVEFQLWGQKTQRWDDGTQGGGAGSGANSGLALSIWDSARGGWLTDDLQGGEFPLDRGAASENDPRDDVHPHAIRVTCVVAQPREFAPEGLLAADVDSDDDVLQLYDGSRFPGASDGGWLKLRGEWLRYTERVGDELRGLRRGQRSTKILEHPAGTRVHLGRTVEFVWMVPHQKDDWNG